VVAVVSWTAVCFVLVRRFVALKQWGWIGAGVATPLAVLVLASWPDQDSLSLRLVIASAIQFGFVAGGGGTPEGRAAGRGGGVPCGAACSPAQASGVNTRREDTMASVPDRSVDLARWLHRRR
jgi:hypothetical protein